jgi:hypothetical protein
MISIVDYSHEGIRTKTRKFHPHQQQEARDFIQRLKDKNFTPTLFTEKTRTPYMRLSAMTYKVWETPRGQP